MSARPETGATIALNALLRIDVSAEIRKLSDAQLQGSWQLGAESVRLAVQCGAQTIRVSTSRHRLRLSARGANMPQALLGHLACVMDENQPGSKRHLALEQLETCSHPVLLSLLSQSIDTLDLTIQNQQGRFRLHCDRGQKPHRLRQAKEHGSPSLYLELKIHDLDHRALRSSLHELCRFCSIPLQVDGRMVTAPLDPGMGQRVIRHPMPGTLTFSNPGQGSRVWLLQDGVIRANLSLPARPWFTAALELSGCVPRDASPADLRSRFEQELPKLILASVDLLHSIASARPDADTQASLRHWVIEIARVPQLLPRVETLPVFPVHHPGQDPRMCSLADLAEALIPALPSGPPTRARPATIDPRDLKSRAHHDTVLIAIESRAQPLLCELLQYHYSAAPARSPQRWWSPTQIWARLRFARRCSGGLMGSWGRRWTRCMGLLGALVPESDLEPDTRRAVAEIQDFASNETTVLVTRGGKQPAWRQGTLLLPLASRELRHWSRLDTREKHAKELLWGSLRALRRPLR